MSPSIETIAARVRSQKQLLPALYKDMVFDTPPERFLTSLGDDTELGFVARLKRQLAGYGHAEFMTNLAECKRAAAS